MVNNKSSDIKCVSISMLTWHPPDVLCVCVLLLVVMFVEDMMIQLPNVWCCRNHSSHCSAGGSLCGILMMIENVGILMSSVADFDIYVSYLSGVRVWKGDFSPVGTVSITTSDKWTDCLWGVCELCERLVGICISVMRRDHSGGFICISTTLVLLIVLASSDTLGAR